jgi:hypothetical protein
MNNQAFLIDLEEDVTYVIYPIENINKKIYDLPNLPNLPNLPFLNIADTTVKKMNNILFDSGVDNILPYHIGDIEKKEKEILINKKYFKLVNILFFLFIILIIYEIFFFFLYQFCNKNDYLPINTFIELLLNLYTYKKNNIN